MHIRDIPLATVHTALSTQDTTGYEQTTCNTHFHSLQDISNALGGEATTTFINQIHLYSPTGQLSNSQPTANSNEFDRISATNPHNLLSPWLSLFLTSQHRYKATNVHITEFKPSYVSQLLHVDDLGIGP